jgi:hypothetical protein
MTKYIVCALLNGGLFNFLHECENPNSPSSEFPHGRVTLKQYQELTA